MLPFDRIWYVLLHQYGKPTSGRKGMINNLELKPEISRELESAAKLEAVGWHMPKLRT